jgi:hypothetical protein
MRIQSLRLKEQENWVSIGLTPGPDPETRDIVQTIYIRRVEKVGGVVRNVEFEKIENVKDPVKARMKN